jgi:hypothetical protein
MVQQTMSYNWDRRRNRLRKGNRGITSSNWYGSRATYRPAYNKHRRSTPEWGALHRAWVGYVIAKSQDDYEIMRKYAIVIRKFQRRLNIAISDFLDIGETMIATTGVYTEDSTSSLEKKLVLH